MGRRKKKIGKRYIFLIIIVIIAIILGILTYSINKKKDLNMFESFFKDAVVYTTKIISKPFKKINNDQVEERDNKIIEELSTENEELRREIEALKQELNITNVLSDYNYLNATVVYRNPLYWYNTITIDKGSTSGIEEGMAVVNSGGLIGKTTNVTPYTCDVKLLTSNDSNNKISVTITSNGNYLYGVISGYNYKNKTLKIEGISNTDDVNIDDKVYTSGLGGIYPSGILIGTVKKIKTDSYDLAKIIEATISADFDDLNFVAVLERSDTE